MSVKCGTVPGLDASWWCAHGASNGSSGPSSLLSTTWPREQEICTLWAFQRSARPQGPSHPPLPSCSLFPIGRKLLQSGLAGPQGADLLGSGYCCVLPSLKRVCEIQDTSQPPTVLIPADASFPMKLQPFPFGLLRLLRWGTGSGSLYPSCSPSTSGHIHPSLPLFPPYLPPSQPLLPSFLFPSAPVGSCSSQLSQRSLPACSLKEQPYLCPPLGSRSFKGLCLCLSV